MDHSLRPDEVINLDRYPIDKPDSDAFNELAERLRDQLDRQQYVVLPDFIRAGARTTHPTVTAICSAKAIRLFPPTTRAIPS